MWKLAGETDAATAQIAPCYRKRLRRAPKILLEEERIFVRTKVSQRMVQLSREKKFCRAPPLDKHFPCASIGSVLKICCRLFSANNLQFRSH
jgi:hypothetical protein